MSKVQRKTPSTSKTSTVSKIQTGTGHHQLQKKNSAAALIEKQVNEAKLKAEADAAEKVKRETEKLVEEKKKVSHTCGNSLVPRPLPAFQCCTLKNDLKSWEWPGDEAMW